MSAGEPQDLPTRAQRRRNLSILGGMALFVLASGAVGMLVGRKMNYHGMALVNLTGQPLRYETRLPNDKLLSGELGHEKGTLLTLPGSLEGSQPFTLRFADGHTTQVRVGRFIAGVPNRGEVRITTQGVTEDWEKP